MEFEEDKIICDVGETKSALCVLGEWESDRKGWFHAVIPF